MSELRVYRTSNYSSVNFLELRNSVTEGNDLSWAHKSAAEKNVEKKKKQINFLTPVLLGDHMKRVVSFMNI